MVRASLDLELDGLTEPIIGAGFAVSNGLGHGFLEAVYRNALVDVLHPSGLAGQAEKAPSDPLKRRFIRAAQSAIRVHPC